MALTKTRTRTQTTLTKLAMLVANVHGELALVERLLGDARAVLAQVEAAGVDAGVEAAKASARTKAAESQMRTLERRRQGLLGLRDSLYATVRQFDPGLDPTDIGSDDGWLKKFGRGAGKAAVGRYLTALSSSFL
jgi:hypothetical protein